MKLRTRRNKVLTAAIVAVVLIAVGYLAGPAMRPRRVAGRRIPAGSYRVEFVYDGDSLRLTNGAEVRLVGIDTPEKGEEMAEEGRAFAKKLLEGQSVRFAPAKDPVDKFKRNLGYLYLHKDGAEVFVNAEMVRRGYAYAWPYKPNWAHREEILAAQEEAQGKRRGLWARRPGKLKHYLVEKGSRFSLTHRPNCPRLKRSRRQTVRFRNRLEALNCNGGAPPCRKCRP